MYTSLSLIAIVFSFHVATLDENAIEKGRQLLKQSKYQDAVECLSAAIENNLIDAEAYYLRAQAFEGLGMFDKAILDLDQSIRLSPEFIEAYQKRGSLYVTLRNYKKALADMTKVIELTPDDPMGYYRRGHSVHAATESYSAMRKDFEKAYDLSDNDIVIGMRGKNMFIGTQLVWLLSTCPDDKVRDGKKALEIALKVKEHYDRAKLERFGILDWRGSEMLAVAYAELGKFQEAMEWQKKAVLYLSQKGDLQAFRKKRAEDRLRFYEMKKPLRYSSTIDWD